MDKAAILIDSSFGIRENTYSDVYIVPMEIIETNNGKVTSYLDQIEISNDQICEKIANGINIKTSQPVLGNVIKKIQELSSKYKQIYAFTIPSTISGTYNNWKMLEQEYKNLKVYDQTMVGRLSEWTIMDLVEANNTGKLNDQLITDYLERIKDKRAGVLVVPDISQLKNGGRVSNFKSILIKLLGLKLIITLDKFGLLFKDKSSKPEDAVKRANSILSTIIPLGKLPIKRFVVFTNSNSDKKFDIKHYVDILKILYPQTKMEFTNVPSVITAHVGPNYLAFGADLD